MLRIHAPRLLPLGILLSLAMTPLRAQTTRPIEVDDLFRLQNVGAPVLSPDGLWAAYTVGTTSLEEEKSETRIWMVSIADGTVIPLTSPGSSASGPRFSPDNSYISFQAARNEGKTQVWVLDRRGGEASQLTDVEQGVNGHRWSPDGSKLLLAIRDAEPEGGWGEDKANAPQEPWVIDRLQFKRDRTGYLTGNRHTHLYVFDVASKQLTQITSGDKDESLGVWSPDGRFVAFVSNRTAEPDGNANSDIWIVAADNTDQGQTLRQVTTNPGSDTQPAWSPDGRSIAYASVVEPELIWYATRHLALVSADGGEPQLLTRDLDRNVSGPRFAEDGRSIYFGLEDSGENHVARMAVSGGRVERPIDGPRSVRGFVLGPDDMIVARIADLTAPGELYKHTGDGLEQLTTTNESFLNSVRLAEVRNVTFPSRDGTEIEGFITLPVGYQEGLQYPTLLRIHGGPVSQFSHGFSFEAQLFAANGYVVIQTNPRGSSGYGQEFSRALWADWGNKDFEDVMAGVDYAIAQGFTDPERLGVGGWSYGGILTNYVITQTDRFEGAITGASEVLYIANYGHDHYQRQWEAELGLPWEGDNREAWERISPFNKVDRVTTPTLVMGGEQDWNVPIQNSEQLYQALRRRGVPTQLVVYPGQSHGLRVPSYQKDRYERYLAWYERWVKRPTEPVTSGGS